MCTPVGSPPGRVSTQPVLNPFCLFFGYDWLDKPPKLLTLVFDDPRIPAGVVKHLAHGTLGKWSASFGEKAFILELEHNRRLRITFQILAQHELNSRGNMVLYEASPLPIVTCQSLWSPTTGNTPSCHRLCFATSSIRFENLNVSSRFPYQVKVGIKRFGVTLAEEQVMSGKVDGYTCSKQLGESLE
jgi:hypothetical protein